MHEPLAHAAPTGIRITPPAEPFLVMAAALPEKPDEIPEDIE
jgi:hypothetical protein